MLVLLPNWFKNKALCARFLNNNLKANVHFAILEEHRHLQFGSDHERERARKLLADEYRTTMRKVWPEWNRKQHTVPANWNSQAIGMDGFLPDDVSDTDYRTVPNVLIRDLAVGVKKMPEGASAADLTRAVLFALQNEQEFRFPEDLPTVLDFIGHTRLTADHTDRALIRTYTHPKRVVYVANQVARQQSNEDSKANKVLTPQRMESHLGHDRITSQTVTPLRNDSPSIVGDQQAWGQSLAQNAPQNTGAVQGVGTVTIKTESTQVDRSMEEMENLIREHLTPASDQAQTPLALTSTGRYPPGHPLRECVEGSMSYDTSPLARAARFAQRPDQLETAWNVEHTLFLNQVLDAAQAEYSESLFQDFEDYV
ncbi:hypothetical protein E8E13_003892 [Curvularia kusanoi]|uniref:Uncharacterized protein n=1 Tax=Curvularia kusanoi TaxID=90978 RepID=A0A9P4W7V7_CURKU|nr:hypothetical protein E8E13_003892 [Curvularia kusanoi]